MVSQTSKETYHREIKGSKENGQNEIVLGIIKRFGVAMTANAIMEYSGLPINVVSRTLNNLHAKLKVIDYFDAKCKITGRKAHHYFFIQEGKQINLF